VNQLLRQRCFVEALATDDPRGGDGPLQKGWGTLGGLEGASHRRTSCLEVRSSIVRTGNQVVRGRMTVMRAFLLLLVTVLIALGELVVRMELK
jgi:hypothetical protein